MLEIRIFSLLILSEAAVLSDLSSGRIPNMLVLTGTGLAVIWQCMWRGAGGLIIWLGGTAVPLVFLPLFAFRMIGAGDIKFLCMIGGFLGASRCLHLLLISLAAGGVMALFLMWRRRNLYERLSCFVRYVVEFAGSGVPKPYPGRTERGAGFCFSIPVFAAVLTEIGGMLS